MRKIKKKSPRGAVHISYTKMGRIKRHRVVPIRYSSTKDWNDVKIVVFILSLLIGANIYYFKELVSLIDILLMLNGD